MSVFKNLTEGLVERNLSRETPAMLKKWEKTGLLEGLTDEATRANMAVLLENQAKQLLQETTTMSGGDVEGFAAVAFPLVRRVFAGLIANELVSVQPMNLPSGLIFFLDITKEAPGDKSSMQGNEYGDGDTRDGLTTGERHQESVYGGGVIGREQLNGVNLGQANDQGFRNLRQGFSSARGAVAVDAADMTVTDMGDGAAIAASATLSKDVEYDIDILSSSDNFTKIVIPVAELEDDKSTQASWNGSDHPLKAFRGSFDRIMGPSMTHLNMTRGDSGKLVTAVSDGGAGAVHTEYTVVRRMTRIKNGYLTIILQGSSAFSKTAQMNAGTTETADLKDPTFAIEFAMADNITQANGDNNNHGIKNGDTLGALMGDYAWEMEGTRAIPEINIKVDSAAITSTSRKLKASWTPELAQDLNAYQSVDAEVELTGILSEEIALEIDQEILGDLMRGATAATYYWSRSPGRFVNRVTGASMADDATFPDFTGTVAEWYETLVETINDVSAQIHRKTLRGGANFIVTSPEVANVLEGTAGFRAKVTHDADKGQAGPLNVGSMNSKFEVYVDPYFPRNMILVGRKGSSFLESGYVYAPYVPLQTTPTIFDPNDFTPRKAVMTRYGKKMVRPDMYGLVVVQDLQTVI